ncbi:unnamed protein product [Cuscuta europaea]|uniref:Uncharacterized protein n=1 Tax=Cuscuta europaea TaxID=41803 RepID=A0A9P0ZR66_CUSEU|nr:unnamed protein product [Cuscuta europaea]
MENDDEDDDFVFEDDTLTWGAVARAAGAYEPSYVTRSAARNDGASTSNNDKGKRIVEETWEEDLGVTDDEGNDDVELATLDNEDDDSDEYC